MATDDRHRYHHADLIGFAEAILCRAGMAPHMATVVAARMLDADLHGHDTHGLALLPRYLREIEGGTLRCDGEVTIVSDRGGAVQWDAQFLPGHYVLQQAVDLAVSRVREHGAVTIAIRRSGHIGALQVYLPFATAAGCLAVIWATDTQARSVAPFGGLDPVFSSEPIAVGIPTSGDPILIDISTSLTSNASVKRALSRGERLPADVLMDADGQATDDPRVLTTDPRGTILPLGGLSHGYKGFGLALAVSAMSLGLTGWGRTADGKSQGIVLQLFDPDAFGGSQSFRREADWMVNASRASRVRPGDGTVRLPGERALATARRQLREGVGLADAIPESLADWQRRLGVAFPEPLS